MDENRTTEAAEAVELSDEEMSAFDEGWGDAPVPAEETAEPEEETADETGEAQPGAEAEADEADDVGEGEAEAEEGEPEPDTQGEEAKPETFQLTHLKETKDYTRDEMVALAQKGLDYDFVRGERDRLKTEQKDLERFGGFVKEMAEAAGLSTDELMEGTRARLLMNQAKAKGETLTEEQARAKVRQDAAPKAEPAKEEQSGEDKAKEAIDRFLQLYPEVKGEDIPQSVWDEANRLGDLVGPWQKYQNKKLSEEIETLRQNKRNRERSTGSRRTAGAAAHRDAFDEGWDSSD